MRRISSITVAALAVFAWLASAQADAPQSYLLSFSGTVDGSDTITISGNSAQWQHNYWDYPTGVTLNGQAWQPQSSPTFTFGAPLIPSSLSGYAIRVNRVQGRDTETAESQGNNLVLKLDDTPNGSAPYQFNVALIPEVPAAPSVSSSLRITGNIDGSDELMITPAAATWVHRYWSGPSAVTVNGGPWDPNSNPVPPNAGSTQFSRPASAFRTSRST